MAVLSLGIGTAQESYEAGFNDGNAEDLPKEWVQNRYENFKPYGTVRIVDAPFAETKYKKAAEVCGSESKAVDLILQRQIPVSAGDIIAIEAAFKTNAGSEARFGFYGSSKKGFNEYDARNFKAISNDWDKRVAILEIKKPETETVKIFVSAKPGTKVLYSHVKITRLDKKQSFYYSTVQSKKLFQELAKGNNLARGKKVTFQPEPRYPLTAAGGTDATDLTDGRFASSNQIWFEKEAVGFEGAHNGASITVDLGKVQSVKKGIIRLQGGRMQDYATAFPDVLEVWVSKDGVHSYLAAKLTKLKAMEMEFSNWKDLYYLPESEDNTGVPYVYPFSLDIKADARFITFRSPVYRLRSMFSDELAVIEASSSDRAQPDYNSVYKTEPRFINHGSIMIYPKMDTFYIAENVYLPNYLYADSLLKENTGKFSYAIDLPQEVTFQPSKAWPADTRRLGRTETKNGRTILYFEPKDSLKNFLAVQQYGFGPFYFSVDHAEKIPAQEKYVIFTTYYNGRKALEVRRGIEFLKMPEVPQLKQLDISLWLEERFKDAPDYHKTSKKTGFTTEMFFPRSVEDARKFLPLVLEAKKQGKKIRLELEPTQRLWVRWKDRNTYRCIGSENDLRSVCLAYRGEEYLKTVEEIRDIVKILPADTITFDIENWEPNRMNASINQCPRCKEAKEKAGFSTWVEYFEKFQADYVKKYAEAAREGAKQAGRPIPRIGYYALAPDTAYRCLEGPVSLLGYRYLYPDYSNEIQKSYYGRSSAGAHHMMRRVSKEIGNPFILVPWLSGGTGAICTVPYSYRTEQHVLETLMNGAGGIQFFSRKSFESPLDYYYLARALSMLAPYENILMKGSLDESLTGSDPNMLYTARKLGRKILFLAGNYERRKKADAVLSLNNIKSVQTLSPSPKATLNDGKVRILVEPDSFGLYLIEI